MIAIVGCRLFALSCTQTPVSWRVAVASFVTGVGMGFASVATIVAVQSVVEWRDRGVVTGSNMFIRTLGSAVGIAVFGGVFNNRATIYAGVHAVFWGLVAAALLGMLSVVFLPAKE